ncbi:hypothetical protein ACFRR7_34750 [Streptomyces sp. NPDC056909]|uniref:hypothetical protein n=1 Tax=Streptomyces sp. NPDC056909 TaxID=3345963 RepID=UPI00367D0659
MTPTPVQFRSSHGDPAAWMPADIDSYEVLADIAQLPPLFDRYMQAFETATKHLGACAACRDGRPCTVGGPVHDRFARLQDEYRGQQTQDRG